MFAHPLLTDWITAGSGLGSFAVLLWLALAGRRRDIARMMPVIEPDLSWQADPGLGRYIKIDLKIVNRLDETLLFASATVDRPRKAAITEGEIRTDTSGRRTQFALASSQATIMLSWHVRAMSEAWHTLYVLPPPSWSGGSVRITLLASSKALTIRSRRIAIVRRMQQLKNIAAEDQASTTA